MYSFLYENMFDSEFSSPQKETMTTEMTSHNNCLNWLKDRKLPVLRDSQRLIFLPKSFFFSANFFLLNSYPQHWPASPCVSSTGLSYNSMRAGEKGAIKSFSANSHHGSLPLQCLLHHETLCQRHGQRADPLPVQPMQWWNKTAQ